MDPKSLGVSQIPAHPTCGSLQGPQGFVPQPSWDTTSVSSSTFSRCHLGAASFGKGLFLIQRDVWDILLAWTIPAPSSMGCILSVELWKDFLFRHPGIFMTPLCVYNVIALEQREINHGSFVSFQEFLMSYVFVHLSCPNVGSTGYLTFQMT